MYTREAVESVVMAADDAAELESLRMDMRMDDLADALDFVHAHDAREDMYHHLCSILDTMFPIIVD